jgi:fructan beta-fructosidase
MKSIVTVMLAAVVPALSVLAADKPAVYTERYRPQFHYTTKKGWINDPCGLVHFDGEYHIFNDHNPFGLGIPGRLKHPSKPPSRWSHGVTKDFVHWEELPIAILPDKLGAIFSGSGVVDRDNTAGFGKNAIVLCYTSAGIPFSQSLSYSLDRGRTWIRYAKNPVVPNQKIDNAERDPRVFWHAPTKRWVMGLHLRKGHARFFTSPDLKDWTHVSDFKHPSIHECPDLFKLPVNGDAKNEKWILYGAGFQYFIGSFDGKEFKPETGPIRGDYGGNFYAAQTWTNSPDSRRVQIAWMSRSRFPGMPFNQQQSFPCVLTLRKTAKGPRLFRWPVKEIEGIYTKSIKLKDHTLKPGENLKPDLTGDLFDIEMEVALGKASEFGLRLHETAISYAGGKINSIGRTAAASPKNGLLSLRILVDRTSVETFVNNGEVSLTTAFVPKNVNTGLEIYAKGAPVTIRSLRVTKLKSSWPAVKPAAASNDAYTVITQAQTRKLKSIRNSYGSIKNLDTLYTDRKHKNGLPYHIYVPKGLKPGEKYAMVTFLHGHTDLTIDTHKGFPKGVWSLPLVQKDHPHILFVPRHRTRKDRWHDEKYRKMVIEALDDLVKEFNADAKSPNIDAGRLYLTGFSLGGMGTWNYIRNHPQKFAAAAPLSGYSHGPQNVSQAEEIKHIPIWIFNGDGDKGVGGSRLSFDMLKKAGAPDVRYHEYKKQGHVIDDFAYFTNGFMDWLFAQKRTSR